MEFDAANPECTGLANLDSGSLDRPDKRKWFAVFTVPQHEESVVKRLDLTEIETFLPTCQSVLAGCSFQVAVTKKSR
jgi:hypothetical protein